MDADIIVIGTGGGALVAALAAHEAGLKPLVLEKEALFGGSTAMSGGVMWMPNNPLQARAGVTDSREQSLRYLDALVAHKGPATRPERREAYVDSAPEVFQLLKRSGVPLDRCDGWADYHDELPGGCTRGRSMVTRIFDARQLGDWEPFLRRGPRAIPIIGTELRNLPLVKIAWSGRIAAFRFALRMMRMKLFGAKLVGMGAALQGRIMKAVRERNIDVRLETPVTGFVVEEGRIVGVEAVSNGKPVTIRARAGVLIAAGGFARNEALRQKYLRQPTSSDWSNANPGDQGDLMEKVVALGAATDTLEAQVFVAGSLPPGSERPALHPATDLGKPHVILVDDRGQRFCDEAGSYVATGEAMYAASAVPCWTIIESRARNRYFWAGAPPGEPPAAWIESGYMKKAESLPDLAGACGIDASALQSTVDHFNEGARRGVDPDFHRGERGYDRWFGDPKHQPNPALGPIEHGPFYAVRVFPGDVGTYGGLVTDADGRILRDDGTPLDGLYATGNSTSSVFGRHYPGAGASIGATMVFGLRAVKHMAARLLN